MSRTRIAALAVAALTTVTATAFAPAARTTGGPLVNAATTVAGAEIVLLEDDHAGQSAVLFLGSVSAANDEYDVLSADGAYSVAALDLGCGQDVGGPLDRATVLAAASWLAGERADDAGSVLPTSGRVLVVGDGINGFQAVSAAATPEGTALAGVATRSGWSNLYDVQFLGGVARQELPGTAPAQPCTTGGATDGAFDAWWSERDLTARADQLAIPTYVQHLFDDEAPYRQSVALLEALADGDAARGTAPLRVVHQKHDQANLDLNATPLPDFRDAVLATDASGRAAAAAELGRRSGGSGSGAPCPSGLSFSCASGAVEGGSGLAAPAASTVTYFLNRTFEQDLDCVPACVPGPGTGEIGTLESTNRFESPWAPVFTWVDAGANSEVVTYMDPLNDGSGVAGDESLPGGHGYHSLAFRTEPFAQAVTVAGTVQLDGWFSTGSAGGTVTPILVRIEADGRTSLVSRGALNLDFAADRAVAEHVAGWKRGTVTFDATEVGIPAGGRLEVILQSSNVGVFAPGAPQATVNVATGPVEGVTDAGSVLHLPLRDGARFDR